jgi:hypothetical protein
VRSCVLEGRVPLAISVFSPEVFAMVLMREASRTLGSWDGAFGPFGLSQVCNPKCQSH